MYLLDTNHCSRIIHGDTQVIERLKEHSGEVIAVSVIPRGELIFMAEKSEQKLANTTAVEDFLQDTQMLSIDPQTATIYGQIKAVVLDKYGPKERAKRRKVTTVDLGFGENDIWIAATSIQHKLVIVSNDSDFSRIDKAVPLKIESWWTPKSL